MSREIFYRVIFLAISVKIHPYIQHNTIWDSFLKIYKKYMNQRYVVAFTIWYTVSISGLVKIEGLLRKRIGRFISNSHFMILFPSHSHHKNRLQVHLHSDFNLCVVVIICIATSSCITTTSSSILVFFSTTTLLQDLV